jgi:protein tyrosine phosphatase (PTP) superfamily phosphohydrolase (DUF442 family)
MVQSHVRGHFQKATRSRVLRNEGCGIIRGMGQSQITGFLRVDERVSTGGQPSESQLEELAADGCKVVINLGLQDPRYSLKDEAASVARAGMLYLHIPVQFDGPTSHDYQRFCDAMAAHQDKRIFVHCAANYRVSSFMALYGEAKLGWTRAAADAWAMKLWEPNETWRTFLVERRQELFPGE